MSKRKTTRRKIFNGRPLLTLPQALALLALFAALFVALDLSKRARDGQSVGVNEETLETEIDLETTRQVELQATLTYVQSNEYIAAYARDEGGYLLPQERRVVPLLVETTPQPPPAAAATPDPAGAAQAWQAWWQLLTDAPRPSGNK